MGTGCLLSAVALTALFSSLHLGGYWQLETTGEREGGEGKEGEGEGEKEREGLKIQSMKHMHSTLAKQDFRKNIERSPPINPLPCIILLAGNIVEGSCLYKKMHLH